MASSGLTSSSSEAGLFFEALQGHGLLLPISSEGSSAPAGTACPFPSAPENTVPSQRAVSLQTSRRLGGGLHDAILGK